MTDERATASESSDQRVQAPLRLIGPTDGVGSCSGDHCVLPSSAAPSDAADDADDAAVDVATAE